MLLWLLALYPMYRTGECIRGWDKVVKHEFQRWLVFWFVFWICMMLRNMLMMLWFANMLLSLYDGVVMLILLGCYMDTFIVYIRRLALIPLLREVRKRVVPCIRQQLLTVQQWAQKQHIVVRVDL